MDRSKALAELVLLIGQDLHELAQALKVEISGRTGRVNKGWAGHVIERYLGLPTNSAQAPNFGSWELKVIPLKTDRKGQLRIKETMAITMIDPVEVGITPFKESHLFRKLKKAVIVARTVGSTALEPSFVHSVNVLDLKGGILNQVEEDYMQAQNCINDPSRGFASLSGRMGVYIQPRTKGAGHGTTSRAFYARKAFLQQFIRV